MAKKMYEEANISAIAEKIREKTGSDTTYKTSEMPSGVEEVYEAGQQSEYDRFWDSFQQNGNRTIYKLAFAGAGWTNDTLKIKYPIVFKPQSYSKINLGLFERCGWQGKQIDFTDICSMIDFSQYPNAESVFLNANAINITCDFSSCTSLESTFMCNDGGIIDNVTVKVSELCTKYTNTFTYMANLINITFVEGSVIAASIDFSASNLTVASMKSVIGALKDYSGTDKEFSYSVKFKDACWETLEADSTSPTGTTWAEYVQDTLCWNI